MKSLVVVITIVITMIVFTISASYSFDEPEMDIDSCKKSIFTSGKLIQVGKKCDVKFDNSEAINLCLYCVKKYNLSDEEVFDLAALGRINFNQEARENGNFRACKDVVEKYPNLFSY